MSLAAKLQLKDGHRVRVVNAPKGLALDIPTTSATSAEALLLFVRNAEELAEHEAAAIEWGTQDKLTWIAYPKAGQLGTDLNRDILWNLMSGKGVKPVRQVALDDVWSALRFRPDA